jgi:glycerol-3-phosphate dehydrogenase
MGTRRLRPKLALSVLVAHGTAMAANLAAAGRRVIAYVRRPDQMDKLAALGLKYDAFPEGRLREFMKAPYVSAVQTVVHGRFC